MRRQLRDALAGITALVGLVAWLAGVPVLLAAWRHNPVPSHVPGWHRLTALIDAGYLDAKVIPNVAAILGWGAYAWVTCSILADAAGRLRHRPSIQPTGRLQVAVGRWLATVALIGALLAHRSTIARATTPLPIASRGTVATLVANGPPTSTPVTVGPHDTATATPDSPSVPNSTYEVRDGDSYWRIAEHHTGNGLRWRELRDANVDRTHTDGTPFTIDSTRLRPGDQLTFPSAWTPLLRPALVPETARPAVHVVVPGDNLHEIAATELGDANRWPEIYDANRDQIDNPNLIHPGQALLLPAGVVDDGVPTGTPLPPPMPPAPDTATPAPPTSVPLPSRTTVAPPSIPPATAATPVTTTRSTASATLATEDASGTEHQDDALPLAPLVGTLSTVTAAAVVWQLRRRRDFALLRRRPHHALPTPSEPARDLERSLIHLADTNLVGWIDATQRALYPHGPNDDRSRILAIQAGPSGIEILWTQQHEPAPPWRAELHGTWRLEPTTTLDELRALGDEHPPRAPAAVTVGDIPTGDSILLDLETAGTLAVDAAPDTTTAILTAMTLELAMTPWSDQLELHTIGAPEPLERLDRVQPLQPDELPALARRLAARYDRAVTVGDDDRPVTVLVIYSPTDLTPLRAYLTTPIPLGFVLVGPVGTVPTTNGFVLTAADGHHGHLSPLGLDLDVITRTRENTLTAAVELVADNANNADASAEVIVDDRIAEVTPVLDREIDDLIAKLLQPRPVEVRVLTAAPTVDGWQTPPSGTIATEVAVFFATRSQPITPLRARSLLYPEGITSEAWRATLSRTRRALGSDAVTGTDHLPAANNGRLAVNETVGCDWHRFTQLRDAARHHTSTDRARLLQAALELIDSTPFTAIPARRYQWVDDPNDHLRQQLTIAIHDTASDLATLALDEGRIAIALRAVSIGLRAGPNEHLQRLAARAHSVDGDTEAADAIMNDVERAVRRHDGTIDLQADQVPELT